MNTRVEKTLSYYDQNAADFAEETFAADMSVNRQRISHDVIPGKEEQLWTNIMLRRIYT